MKTIGKMPQHTVFFKFIAVNIAVLAMFYGITLYINSRIAYSQEKDIYQSIMNKMELFMNKIDADITRQKRTQYQFSNMYNLQKLSIAGNRLSDYDKVNLIQQIQIDVLYYKMMCEYCDNITISIPAVERMISVQSILDYYRADDSDVGITSSSEPQLLYLNGNLHSIMNFSAAIKNRKPLFTIDNLIDTSQIVADMRTYFNENAENAMLLASSGSWHLDTAGEVDAGMLKYFNRVNDRLMNTGKGLIKLDINGTRCWVVYRYSQVMDAFFISYRPERIITETLTSTRVTIWIVSAFTILMLLFSIFWIRGLFDEPMSQLMGALSKVEKGDLKMNIRYKRDDEFRYVYEKFNNMVVELNRLIELNYEQRIRAQQAELKQLQYHIQPHFLYNSIFLIYRMAGDEDLEAIRDFSLTLGSYYRYITRIQNETIPLEREVDHIRNFIKIQSVRFGERITVHMDPIPTGYESLPVLPLILQPIVENAYQHGVSMMESDGLIEIRIIVAHGILTVTIDDNCKGMAESELQELSARIIGNDVSDTNSGLANVHHRLRIYFGPESGLRLETSPLGGLRVILELKIGGSQND